MEYFSFNTKLVIPGEERKGPQNCTVEMLNGDVIKVTCNGLDITEYCEEQFCSVETQAKGFPVRLIDSLAIDGRVFYERMTNHYA